MPAFTRKWPEETYEACFAHKRRHGLSMEATAKAAAAGEIPGLEPTPIPVKTLYSHKREMDAKELGRIASPIAEKPARDAVEELRRRIVSAADGMLRVEERRAPEKRSAKRLSEIAQLVKMAAAIPDQREPAPRLPGHRKPDGTKEPKIRTELARRLIEDARRTPTAQGETHNTHHTRQNETAQQHTTPQAPVQTEADALPGARVLQPGAPAGRA